MKVGLKNTKKVVRVDFWIFVFGAIYSAWKVQKSWKLAILALYWYWCCICSCLLACADDKNWKNPSGYDCSDYAKRWCENGKARAGQEWTLGKSFNHPENHCCACGKLSSEWKVLL